MTSSEGAGHVICKQTLPSTDLISSVHALQTLPRQYQSISYVLVIIYLCVIHNILCTVISSYRCTLLFLVLLNELSCVVFVYLCEWFIHYSS